MNLLCAHVLLTGCYIYIHLSVSDEYRNYYMWDIESLSICQLVCQSIHLPTTCLHSQVLIRSLHAVKKEHEILEE